jgi:hypothetical protein
MSKNAKHDQPQTTVPDALDLTEHARLAITTPPIVREES